MFPFRCQYTCEQTIYLHKPFSRRRNRKRLAPLWILMFCLCIYEPLVPVLYPLGGRQMHPKQTITTPWSSFSQAILLLVDAVPSISFQSPTTGLFEAGQAGSGGPPQPSAPLELPCSLWFRGCGTQSYQESSQRGFKSSQCISPGHQQGQR